MDDFVDEYYRRTHIRQMRPRRDFLEASETAKFLPEITNGRTRYLPILPGLMAYMFALQPGARCQKHAHVGTECVVALRGTATMEFWPDAAEGRPAEPLRYELSGEASDVLVYGSYIPHATTTVDGAELLVAHYDPKMARRWRGFYSLFLGGGGA